MTRRSGWGVSALCAVALLGCRPLEASALRSTFYPIVGGDPHEVDLAPGPSPEQWKEARARFDRLRADMPARPWVERVRLAVLDPRTGKVVQARGAVAVDPGKAARLLLVGPGGTTALDLWVTPDAWRVSIPALHLERRGGRDLGDALGLPIGFVRWWFLAPVEGELLYARGSTLWYRNATDVVMLRVEENRLLGLRRGPNARVDGVEWSSTSLAPSAGASGRYLDLGTRLRVDVLVEAVMPGEPEAEAFADPDAGTPP